MCVWCYSRLMSCYTVYIRFCSCYFFLLLWNSSFISFSDFFSFRFYVWANCLLLHFTRYISFIHYFTSNCRRCCFSHFGAVGSIIEFLILFRSQSLFACSHPLSPSVSLFKDFTVFAHIALSATLISSFTLLVITVAFMLLLLFLNFFFFATPNATKHTYTHKYITSHIQIQAFHCVFICFFFSYRQFICWMSIALTRLLYPFHGTQCTQLVHYFTVKY